MLQPTIQAVQAIVMSMHSNDPVRLRWRSERRR